VIALAIVVAAGADDTVDVPPKTGAVAGMPVMRVPAATMWSV
jgi:hypothetical protein